MNETNSQASGAFGGSRHGVMQAETNRGYGDLAAKTVAGLNADNFSQAQGAAFGDIANRFAASQANQSADLQAQMANANSGMTNNAQKFQTASGLASLSNLGFSQGQSALDSQMNAGNMQQSLMQSIIDAGKQQTLGDTGFADNAIARLLGVTGSVPSPVSTSESSSPGLMGLLTAFL